MTRTPGRDAAAGRAETEGPPGGEVRVGVAVPAAGWGRRMGGVRKAFLELSGAPLLVHALRPFLTLPEVIAVAVALPEEDAGDPPAWLTGLDPRVRVVAGGASRTASVRGALAALPTEANIIAVHDAARPLVTREVIRRCIHVAAGGEGAVAGIRAVDTIKETDRRGRIVSTPDRSALWQAQTPQVFPADILRKAYSLPDAEATDDAALVERAGGRVRMVEVEGWNLKVTRPEDAAAAAAILAARTEPHGG
ncbi:MAG: 2-C-methyl-D-erythritol 4-phosphate cytidylyltransferase [Gemmatimonadota bacterium]